jgi:hypothetical protein
MTTVILSNTPPPPKRAKRKAVTNRKANTAMKNCHWIGGLSVVVGAVLVGRGFLHLSDPLVPVARWHYFANEQPGFAGIAIGGLLIVLGVGVYRKWPPGPRWPR